MGIFREWLKPAILSEGLSVDLGEIDLDELAADLDSGRGRQWLINKYGPNADLAFSDDDREEDLMRLSAGRNLDISILAGRYGSFEAKGAFVFNPNSNDYYLKTLMSSIGSKNRTINFLRQGLETIEKHGAPGQEFGHREFNYPPFMPQGREETAQPDSAGVDRAKRDLAELKELEQKLGQGELKSYGPYADYLAKFDTKTIRKLEAGGRLDPYNPGHRSVYKSFRTGDSVKRIPLADIPYNLTQWPELDVAEVREKIIKVEKTIAEFEPKLHKDLESYRKSKASRDKEESIERERYEDQKLQARIEYDKLKELARIKHGELERRRAAHWGRGEEYKGRLEPAEVGRKKSIDLYDKYRRFITHLISAKLKDSPEGETAKRTIQSSISALRSHMINEGIKKFDAIIYPGSSSGMNKALAAEVTEILQTKPTQIEIEKDETFNLYLGEAIRGLQRVKEKIEREGIPEFKKSLFTKEELAVINPKVDLGALQHRLKRGIGRRRKGTSESAWIGNELAYLLKMLDRLRTGESEDIGAPKIKDVRYDRFRRMIRLYDVERQIRKAKALEKVKNGNILIIDDNIAYGGTTAILKDELGKLGPKNLLIFTPFILRPGHTTSLTELEPSLGD